MKNTTCQLKRKLIASSVFVCLSVALMAQTNFSGTWAFNESKSNFGDSQFRFAASALVVTQDATLLSVERTMQGRDGNEMKMSDKYKLDGSVSENQGFGNSVSKSTLTWSADKTSITIVTSMSFERDGQTREFKTTQTWSLADGGKTLMINNSMPTPDGGERKTSMAYDKK